MSALISFRDEVGLFAATYPLNHAITVTGGAVVAGDLKNLYTRQLENGAVIKPNTASNTAPRFELSVNVPGSMVDPVSLAGVRMIAVLGIVPFEFNRHAPANPRFVIYGMPGRHKLGELSLQRAHGIDPEIGPVNRILPLPASTPNPGSAGMTHTSYLIEFRDNSASRREVKIGRIWIGNAVELPDGVDADWSFGVAEAGSVAVSRGGQAYASRGQALKTLRAAISGPALDERLAFGIGVATTPEGVRHESDCLSDCALHTGATGNIIIVPRTDDDWVQRIGIYGRLTSPIQIEHLAGEYYRAALDVVEER